ncbi:MAG: serine hydrolase domain-containing protein, partial [Hyphomonadaceae bacterium]
GHLAPGFERVADVLARALDAGEEIGAGFAAVQNGAILVNIWGGHADRARTQPWARNTIAPVYSATKPISALVLGRLIDSRDVRLETPVAHYWPPFAAAGKETVTIAQALSHQAGLAGFPAPIDPELWLDPPALSAQLAALAPLWPPGTASGYHPLTWGYLIETLAERIAGRTVAALLEEEICAPRDIDFRIGLPESEDARTAEMRRPTRLPDLGARSEIKRAAFLAKWSAPDRADPRWRRLPIPSANGYGTALALAQLYSIYAQRGLYDGEKVFSETAWRALTARRIEGEDLVLPFRLDWRGGILGNNLGLFGPNPHTLGHYGWGGACGVADADAGLAIGYVTNQQSHHLMGDPRPRALISALYACLS